jgi:hypothetical protein
MSDTKKKLRDIYNLGLDPSDPLPEPSAEVLPAVPPSRGVFRLDTSSGASSLFDPPPSKGVFRLDTSPGASPTFGPLPPPRGVAVQMGEPRIEAQPPGETQGPGGWLHDSLARATQDELAGFKPPPPPGFFPQPQPQPSVDVQMGEPRIESRLWPSNMTDEDWLDMERQQYDYYRQQGLKPSEAVLRAKKDVLAVKG